MKITEFFTQFSSICSHSHPVICFTGKTYQSLFLETVYDYMQKQLGQTIKKVTIDQDFAEIQAQLTTTFLGQTHWYWLGNLGAITAKKKRESYIDFVKKYQGPHRLVVFIPEDQKGSIASDNVVCTIQETYEQSKIKQIPVLYQGSSSEVFAYFFSKLFRVKKEYSLDQLCLLKEYALLLGKNMGLFFDKWLEQLVVSDVSLFYLSQLFFEKNASEFFAVWQQIRGNYADQFWTVYFSEQLFKAYFYVQHQGQVPIDQKQLLFGLPFSFIKHDWKLYQDTELLYAHQKLYTIDLSLKQGGSAYQLDAFIVSFFNKAFV